MTHRQLVIVELLVTDVVAVFVLLVLLAATGQFDVAGFMFPSRREPIAVAEQVALVLPTPTPPITVIPVVATREPSPTPMPSSTATRTPTATATATPIVVRTEIAARFLTDYLLNRTYADIVEARPWAATSLNVWQYTQEMGGVTFWDYFASTFGQGFEEDWSSSRYGWLDEQGRWQTYRQETVKDARGRDVTAYVLVDRTGPGAIDKIVFTQYSVAARPGDSRNPDLAEWGLLANLGRMRIQVDGRTVYDVPVEEWFSGAALCLPPDLARLFFWRYRDFGSSGGIFPIPFQSSVKVSVYGGIEKPKWFTVTGVTFPPDARVNALGGCLDAATQDALRTAAPNVTAPEAYLQGEDVTSVSLAIAPPSASQWRLDGAGTLTGLQLRVPRNYDVSALDLTLAYGDERGVTLPLIALFSDQDRMVKHRSAPIGVVDDPEDARYYLFYLNYPLPFQHGLTLALATRGGAVTVEARYARSSQVKNTQFRIAYDGLNSRPPLQPLGPDYRLTLPGDGKLVGVVLTTRGYEYNAKEIPAPPPDLVRGAGVFPMGYMESNVTLRDGRGAVRVYSGLEDFADGGYDFDSDKGAGGRNLPFAGVLGFSFNPPEKGYFTIFRYWNDLCAFRFKQGLSLAIQHGTWKNNFNVRYGAVVLYYAQVQ